MKPHLIIILSRTDAIEIVKGQWLLRNCCAFFSSASLPWEVLPTVPVKVIAPVRTGTVVLIKYVDCVVMAVGATTIIVDRTRNAVVTRVLEVPIFVSVRMNPCVDGVRYAVSTNAPEVCRLVPARPKTNVD